MKWLRNHNTGPEYITSDCGRYMVNKGYVQGIAQYMAVRLGTPDRGAWKGSVILGVVGTADEAKQLCEVDSGQAES